MIRNVHTAQLRELVAQAERDLAGWQFLLAQAEQGERAGTVFPDPMAAAGGPSTPWIAVDPLPPAGGREPYPTTVMPVTPAIDGSALPPSQEAAIAGIWAEHDQQAQTPKAHKEEQQWRNA
jgi:hypothetical protein